MDESYTLEELEKLSGINRRMIRHYIGLNLVDGPTERGRYASYPPSTLRRLKVIRRLQSTPVEPLGRPVTTGEIRQVLETLGERGLEQLLAGGTLMRLYDTDAPKAAAGGALAYLRDLSEPSAIVSSFHLVPAASRSEAAPQDPRALPAELRELLERLLLEIDGALQQHRAVQATRWQHERRAQGPGLEIRIKSPLEPDEHSYLQAVAAGLRRLLAGTEES